MLRAHRTAFHQHKSEAAPGRGEVGGGESKERETRTHRIKRQPIVCRAASSASSGSAPAGVRLERIDSRKSDVPRELSNVPASAASSFDARTCCSSASITSAGEGCCCCCCCCCCWAAGEVCCPVAAGSAPVPAAGSAVCEPEATAALDAGVGVAEADADAEGGVGKGLSDVILGFSFSFLFSGEEGGREKVRVRVLVVSLSCCDSGWKRKGRCGLIR